MRCYLRMGLPLAALTIVSASQALVLDFEGPKAGTRVTNQFDGVKIWAHNPIKLIDTALIFDSSNPTLGNHDFKTGNSKIPTDYGNILIVASNNLDLNFDGRVDFPDVERLGGSLFFKFDQSYTSGSTVLIDTDIKGGSIDFYLSGHKLHGQTMSIPKIGDGYAQTLDWSGFTYDKVVVNFAGSGAVAEMSAVPEPGTMALLGIGASALIARRRRKALHA